MKSSTTLSLERDIFRATRKHMGVFGCFEVTIGFYGHERVDYLTYDSKGVWRCYEIKATLADFRSKAALSFVGHFNYFVFTPELYEQVAHEIPADIGVYVGRDLVKRPRRRELAVDESVLIKSLIRSLYRYADDRIRSDIPSTVESLRRQIARMEADLKRRNRFDRKEWEDTLELQDRRRADRQGVPFDLAAFERKIRRDDEDLEDAL